MRRKTRGILLVVILASIIAWCFLVPLAFLVFTSFKGLSESIGSSRLFPVRWTLDNYVSVIKIGRAHV